MHSDWIHRNLILVMGKGGVGKSTVAHALARELSRQGKRTLLCHVLQISEQEQKMEEVSKNFWEITLRASDCFREYIMLKLKVKALYTAFLGNSVTQYFERAAPGVREMVLLGKIWYERQNFDHVVVDMPSTGYALVMIHTPFNFSALFPGGPIHRDAEEMIATFKDPEKAALVTVSLAEEMPIQESLELAANLKTLMPTNPSELVLNRLIRVEPEAKALYETHWPKLGDAEKASPLWRGLDHLILREKKQRKLLEDLKISWQAFSNRWTEIDEVNAKSDDERRSYVAQKLERPQL